MLRIATLMHLASRAVAAGADFWLLGAERTQLKSKVPVISVCAVRTGCGKSPVSRRVAAELRSMGWKPVVIRHPMPYGDLAAQRAQRFGTLADLDRHQVHHRRARRVRAAHHGRHHRVMPAWTTKRSCARPRRKATSSCGTAATTTRRSIVPTSTSWCSIRIAPGHELAYYPGRSELPQRARAHHQQGGHRRSRRRSRRVRQNIALHNPKAQVIETACTVTVADPEASAGKRVLVVEDGPTLTHGEMPYGAGVVAANRYGAAQLVDPRPYAVGSIQKTFEKFPHLWQRAAGDGLQRHAAA